MKEKMVSVFWGAALIVLGGWFLLTGRTSISSENPWVGVALFGGLSVLFFASYFLTGISRWGWLFPSCISAALALTIFFSTLEPGGPGGGWVASPIFVGVAVPFLVAYLQKPQARRWALIPAWVMLVMTLVVIFADRVQGEFIGALFMFAVALPFLVVYLMDRTRTWALIPFGVISAVALIPLLASRFSGESMGVVVMLLFAVPFLVVYLWRADNWWALIPSGVFFSIAATVLVTLLVPEASQGNNTAYGGIIAGVLFLGFALTFLLLWLRRGTAPTFWAIYPAIALGLMGAVGLLGGARSLEFTWPLALIIGGGLMLYNSWRQRRI